MTERDPAPPRPSCVLVVHNRYRIRGGEDSVFEAECRLLEEAGVRVVRYERSNDDIPDGGGPFAKLGLALCTVWNPRTYREVREILRRERPDAMHCHNTFPQISPSVYYAAAREGVPVVQTLHNYRLACLDGYLFRDGRVCERCLGRAPLPGVCRRCYRGSLSASATLAAMLLVHRLLGTWRRKVTRYIALTDFAKEKFVQAGLPACKISVKPNAFVASDEGVGLRATVERSGASAPGRQQRVVYVGRLSSEKGVDVLLRAWALLLQLPPSERGVARSAGGSIPCAADPAPSAALPRTEYSPSLASLDSPLSEGADQNAHPSQAPGGPGATEPPPGPAPTCKIIGDGPERAALESLAAELGISSSVSFLGALPREAALRELAASDLLVLPSLCYETFGLAVVEAASMGIAAIVPAHSAPSSLVRDGVTGRHVAPGDPVALASALRDFLSDPAALRRMGDAARAAFEASDCRPDRNLARLLSVYASARSAHDTWQPGLARETGLPRISKSARIAAMNTSLSSTVKTADWKAEKHVPVIAAPATAKAGVPIDVEIDVGKEIPHPNTAQHHIVWIALHFVPDGSNTSIELGRADFSAHGASMSDAPGPAATAPSARFRVSLAVPGILHAMAYCNLHGLWTSSAPVTFG